MRASIPRAVPSLLVAALFLPVTTPSGAAAPPQSDPARRAEEQGLAEGIANGISPEPKGTPLRGDVRLGLPATRTGPLPARSRPLLEQVPPPPSPPSPVGRRQQYQHTKENPTVSAIRSHLESTFPPAGPNIDKRLNPPPGADPELSSQTRYPATENPYP